MAKVGVMFMPSPGIGHLISTVELAKLLLKDSNSLFSIIILTMDHEVPSRASTIKAYIKSVTSLNLNITFEGLPRVEYPHHQKGETFVTRLIEAHKPFVRDAISRHLSSSTPLSALVLDLFCTSMIDVANEFHIPSYIYFTLTAAMLSLMFYLPNHYIKDAERDYVDLPGLASLPMDSLPVIMRDKNDEDCKIFLGHGERFKEAKGIIVNTFDELEPASLQALADGCCLSEHPTLEIFAVGPLLSLGVKDGPERHDA